MIFSSHIVITTGCYQYLSRFGTNPSLSSLAAAQLRRWPPRNVTSDPPPVCRFVFVKNSPLVLLTIFCCWRRELKFGQCFDVAIWIAPTVVNRGQLCSPPLSLFNRLFSFLPDHFGQPFPLISFAHASFPFAHASFPYFPYFSFNFSFPLLLIPESFFPLLPLSLPYYP